MLAFPADQAAGVCVCVCDRGATHQHAGHDWGAVRGAETGSRETAAPVSVSQPPLLLSFTPFTLTCCTTVWEHFFFFLRFIFLAFADIFTVLLLERKRESQSRAAFESYNNERWRQRFIQKLYLLHRCSVSRNVQS